jgi:hypothetical protein
MHQLCAEDHNLQTAMNSRESVSTEEDGHGHQKEHTDTKTHDEKKCENCKAGRPCTNRK